MNDVERYWKSNPAELWKDIEGYEGLYQISNMGRVFSFPRNGCSGGILCPSPDKDGYLRITLQNKGVKKKFAIHRLVALAYIPNDDPFGKPMVNHLDFNRKNNNADNLEWASAQRNRQYRRA